MFRVLREQMLGKRRLMVIDHVVTDVLQTSAARNKSPDELFGPGRSGRQGLLAKMIRKRLENKQEFRGAIAAILIPIAIDVAIYLLKKRIGLL